MVSRHQNILLVYPEVPKNTYWSFQYTLKFIKKKSSMPPLGLITIAALFPESYNLRLVDLNIEELKKEDIIWSDAVFISAMIVQKESMEFVIDTCKKLGKTIVAGGPYVTSSWRGISGVDHFVMGEAEDIFHTFLDDFEKGTAGKVYSGSDHPDITNSVVPRFDLLRFDAYGSMAIQYSRGCPFRCDFCDIWKTYGNKPRLKSAENVVKELDVLFQLGWEGAVFIVDDNFIGNKKRVKNELLPAFIKWQRDHDYVFRFFTEASINIASDTDLLNGMRNAAFNEVFIGIETPSRKALKEAGKNQNLKTDILEAVKTVQGYGIEVMAGFILGFDSDSDDIFERQIEFIQQSGIPQAMVGLLTALPGTDLYDRMKKERRLITESSGNNTHNMMANFQTKIGNEKLKNGYQHVLGTIYDRNLKNYFTRCTIFMNNLGQASHFQRDIKIKEIKMLVKSLALQPFTPYGYQYLKFVVKNVTRHRHIFGEVIKFAIIGHHFHTITQETLKMEQVSCELDEGVSYFSSQLSRYSQQMAENSRDAVTSITRLWERKKVLLKRTRKRIDHIHVDFQSEILKKYAEVSDRLWQLFKTYEKDLGRSGIV
jgi:radical SAM superfamily enzyme YgiQ (UPF0313 family)